MNEENNSIYLSVVIPAYNEERRIGSTLSKIRKYLDAQPYAYEVIVVSDGSTDTTVPIVNIIKEGWPQVRIIDNQHNQGKGAVVKQGVLASIGKYILFTDADNATPIEEVAKLLEHIVAYPMVFGSRYTKGSKIHIFQSRPRVILSRLSNLLIRIVVVPGVWDTQCGFKLFQNNAGKNIFANVRLTHFGFDIESFVIARKLGYKFKEVGINWYNDFETKVRTGREAVRTLTDLFRIRINLSRGKYNSVGYIHQSVMEPVTKHKTPTPTI